MKRFIVLLALILLAGCSAGRGCRTDPPPPTPTIPPPPATLTATPTMTASPQNTPPTERPTATPTSTPDLATATPTRPILAATPVATATPALLGHHEVTYGETMFGIGLEWYAGQFFAWGREVWEPICAANPEIADCRMIFVGDVLRIPAR